MKPATQFTHQRMGLDQNIWVVMLITSVLCLGLLGYKAAFEKKCAEFDIGIKNISSGNAKVVYAGETLSMTTTSTSGKSITWDFGDKSDTKDGSLVMHTYSTEGNFPLMAKIDGNCDQITMVTVRKYAPVINKSADSNVSVIAIMGKDDPEVGEQVTFSSNTPATTYEWTILDRRDYETKKGVNVNYSFRTPGRYVLKLKLDNDASKVSTKYIMVIPPSNTALLPTKKLIPPVFRVAPPAETKVEEKPVEQKTIEKPVETKEIVEPPKPKKVTFIPNEPFTDYLKEVVEGSKDLSFFNKYLNNGGETLVQVKGEDKLIKFSDLFQRIHSNKKISIKEVSIDRDANNDVLKINISYKKRLF